jgi:DNA-binding CsgD family transcriptional regulator
MIRELSPAERRSLIGAAMGLTGPELAQQCGLSLETVKTQRRKLLLKLGARNVAHAIALAYERKLLEPGLLSGRLGWWCVGCGLPAPPTATLEKCLCGHAAWTNSPPIRIQVLETT